MLRLLVFEPSLALARSGRVEGFDNVAAADETWRMPPNLKQCSLEHDLDVWKAFLCIRKRLDLPI